ncbi:hypothetical protein SETIT_4G285700v2 [Setaria italica]|uniref:Exocyst subunit Exo70 family protein n=2 Tax=Setaria italica TaxID=4555 RepID=A0A368QZ93_SETIT|nr:hypothetical protein SETIT_4G285700v2 [Setaria italica]
MEDIHGGELWNNRKTGESMATSSSSGNTLSTNQLTSGSGSWPLPFIIFDQVVVEPPGSWPDDDETRQRRQHIKGLLEQFCGGIGGDSSAALKRWFSDLGIAWVLRVAADARLLLLQDQRNFPGRWIQALADITESILDTYYLCFSHSHLESFPEESEASVPDPVHFSRFIQETMLKMLSFVDAIVAPNPNTSCIEEIIDSNGALAPLERLKTLFDVRGAVFMASFLIQPLLLRLSSSAQTESCRALEDMEALRSDKDDILAEAIWNTMQEVTAAILTDDGNHDSWEDTPQEPASIHKVTRSIERYIRLLEMNYRSVDQIVRKAADCGTYAVPAETYNKTNNPFTSMMADMVSCLEEKLTKMSQSFPNKSLGLLFLINNLHSLWQQLHPMYDTKFNMPVLTRKIEDYIDKYLQEAWEPVLARLHTSPSPLQFGRRYFPKVLDPELRKKLRKAITDKVTSGFTNFLEEDTVSTRGSTITPQEVEDMLQELFEG